jgi:hypothetical protein
MLSILILRFIHLYFIFFIQYFIIILFKYFHLLVIFDIFIVIIIHLDFNHPIISLILKDKTSFLIISIS